MANIDVLDRRRTGSRTGIDAFLERVSNRVDRTIIVDQNWSIHRICSRVRHHGPVGVLRILCHGNSSYMELGTGIRVPGDTTSFQLLRGSWVGEYPKIEIHACGVASATPVGCTFRRSPPRLVCVRGTSAANNPGRRLVQAIADNAGVLVVASLDVQRGAPGLEGTIVHCRPAVSYTVRDLIRR